jgi:hypothetical protein
MADELRDIELDENRQVHIAADGDFAVTNGVRTVEQSVAILAGNVLRPLIGEPLDGDTLLDIQSELTTILKNDVQIESVNNVEIVTVNRAEGTVTLRVNTDFNNSFEITPTV